MTPAQPPDPSASRPPRGVRSRRTVENSAPDGHLSTDGGQWHLSPISPRADQVPYVRHQAALVLQLWELDDVQWVVELLVTELISNVIRHARTPYSVGLSWDGTELRGEVVDAGPMAPLVSRALPALDGIGGRGLLLVQEMASAWGYDRHDDGKTVWFRLDVQTSRDQGS